MRVTASHINELPNLFQQMLQHHSSVSAAPTELLQGQPQASEFALQIVVQVQKRIAVGLDVRHP